MKKKVSIKKNYQFKYILNKGKRKNNKITNIYICNNKVQENRIGIAISKNIKGSVTRNRIKRLVRQSWYDLRNNTKKGYDIIILVKYYNPNFKQKQFFKEIEENLKNENII